MGDPAEFSDLEGLFQRVVEAVFALGGLASFAYILIGAFKYLTSGGDDKAIQAAKGTLTFAVIGLVICVGAWAFWSTILRVNVLDFKFPGMPAGSDPIRFDLPPGTP